MPFEFEDVSKKVADGSASVKDSLDNLVGAAEAADKAHAKLSDTQKASLVISQKYSKALDGQAKSTLRLAKASVATVKAMSGISGISKTIAGTLLGISASADKVSASIGSIETPVKVAEGVEKVGDAIEKTKNKAVTAKDVIAKLADEMDEVKKSATVAEKGAGKLADTIEKVEKATTGARDASGKFVKGVKKQKDGSDKANDAAKRLGKSLNSLNDEVKEQAGLIKLLGNKYEEGANEAENFAGGIGASSGLMTGAGVAAFYLGQKIADLIDGFTDAAVGLSKFNVQAAQLSKTTIGIDSTGLKNLRDDLSLTREQASEFYKVLQSGSTSGVVSVEQLSDAAKALQDAFGGDPTDKLREYVELLELIPTIETDLSITADIDDQTASLFALAKAGKIDAAIDLQSAGLLGGVGPATQSDDVKMLNEAQKANKLQEDIKDFWITKLFPSWGPKFSVMAQTGLKGVAAIGGVVAATGAVSIFLNRGTKKQVAAIKDVEQAVKATALGRSVGTGTGTGPRNAKQQLGLLKKIYRSYKRGGVKGAVKTLATKVGGRKLGTAFAKGGVKGLTKTGTGMATAKATKALKMFTGSLKGGSGGLKLFSRAAGASLKGLTIIGLAGMAMEMVGGAAVGLGKKMEQSGSIVAGTLTQVGGAAMGMAGSMVTWAAAGAALGSVIPGLGTAIGAAVGAVAGFAISAIDAGKTIGGAISRLGAHLRDASDYVDENGNEIKKFKPALSGFGSLLYKSGEFVAEWGKEAGNELKYIGAFWKKQGRNAGDAIGDWAKGFVYTEEHIKASKGARDSARSLSASFKNAMKSSTGFGIELGKSQKATHDSYLAFQSSIKGIEAAANTAKVQLSGLNREIASLNISALAEFGGTVSDFNAALADATSATTSKFKELSGGFAEQRKIISSNAKLNAEQRKAALTDLNKVELEATQEFVQGISEVISSLLQTPGIIQAGLRSQIEGSRIDFSAETLGAADFAASVAKEFDAASDVLSSAVDQIEKLPELQEARSKALEDAAANVRDQFKKSFKTLPDDVKTTITGSLKLEDGADIGEISTASLTGGAAEAAKKLQDEIDVLGKEIKKAGEDIPSAEFGEFAAAFGSLAQEQKQIQEDIKEQTEIAQNSKKDLEERNKAEENLVALRKKAEASAQKQAQVTEELKKTYGDYIKDEQDIVILQAIISGDTKKLKQLTNSSKEGAKRVQKLISEFPGIEEKGKVALKKRLELQEKQNQLSTAQAQISGLATQAQDTTNQNLKEQAQIQQELFDTANSVASSIARLTELKTKEMDEAKRALSISESMSSLSGLTGLQLANFADIAEGNRGIYDATIKSVEEGNATLEKMKVKLKEQKTKTDEAEKARVKQLIGSGKTVEDATKIAAGEYAKVRATNDKLAREIEVGAEDLLIASNEAAAKMVEGTKQIEGAIQAAFSDFGGRTISAELDLADAKFEFAEFSKDFASISKEATDMAVKAAKKKAQLEADAIEAGAQESGYALLKLLERVEKDALAAGQSPQQARAAAEAARATGERTIEAERQAALEKTKTDLVKAQADAIKKSADLAERALDSRQSVVEAEMDFLSEIGGDFGRIFELQKQSLSIEQQKLDVSKQALQDEVALNGESLKTDEMRNQIRIKEFEIQKKAFGAQKSVYEKMAGMAFGQIRSSTGAARFRTSAASLMGRDASRVKTRSGLVTGAGDGPTTIRGRAAELQKARGSVGPKKLKMEEEIAEGLRKNEDANKNTASATAALAAAGTTPGSLYTHDLKTVDELKKMNDSLLKLVAITGTTISESASSGMDAEMIRIGQQLEDELLGKTSGADQSWGKEADAAFNALEQTTADGNDKVADKVQKTTQPETAVAIQKTAAAAKKQTMEYKKSSSRSEKMERTVKQAASAKAPRLGTAESMANNRLEGKGFGSGRLEGKGFGSGRLEGKGPASKLAGPNSSAQFTKLEGKGFGKSEELKQRHEAAFGAKAGAGPGAASAKEKAPTPTEMTGAETAQMAAEQRNLSGGSKAENMATGAQAGFAVQQANVQDVTAGGSGGGGRGGDGGAAGGDVAFKFRGEIMVKFNTDMFRAQVIQVMAEGINHEQVRTALLKAGYVNKSK